ncbi:hypothetical protein NL676_038015 [Syzygium grande]|nr:hypothetical protein NL676_038015 [Syzygium grande]
MGNTKVIAAVYGPRKEKFDAVGSSHLVATTHKNATFSVSRAVEQVASRHLQFLGLLSSSRFRQVRSLTSFSIPSQVPSAPHPPPNYPSAPPFEAYPGPIPLLPQPPFEGYQRYFAGGYPPPPMSPPRYPTTTVAASHGHGSKSADSELAARAQEIQNRSAPFSGGGISNSREAPRIGALGSASPPASSAAAVSIEFAAFLPLTLPC